MPRGYTRYLQSRNRQLRSGYLNLPYARNNYQQYRAARRYSRVIRNIPAAAELRRYTRIGGRYVPHIWRNISRRL